MKIQKHGKKFKQESNIKTFKCDNCGCEFTVKQDEYYVDEDIEKNNYWTAGSTCSYTISTMIKDKLVCSCPECHKIVSIIIERDNPSITLNSNITSVNALDTTPQVTWVGPEINMTTTGTTAK